MNQTTLNALTSLSIKARILLPPYKNQMLALIFEAKHSYIINKTRTKKLTP